MAAPGEAIDLAAIKVDFVLSPPAMAVSVSNPFARLSFISRFPYFCCICQHRFAAAPANWVACEPLARGLL